VPLKARHTQNVERACFGARIPIRAFLTHRKCCPGHCHGHGSHPALLLYPILKEFRPQFVYRQVTPHRGADYHVIISGSRLPSPTSGVGICYRGFPAPSSKCCWGIKKRLVVPSSSCIRGSSGRSALHQTYTINRRGLPLRPGIPV